MKFLYIKFIPKVFSSKKRKKNINNCLHSKKNSCFTVKPRETKENDVFKATAFGVQGGAKVVGQSFF